MDAAARAFVAGFPHFMIYGAVTLAMLVAGVMIHVLMTPMKEIKLLRAGNTSAAVSLAGIVLGLAIPLSASLASALSLYDVLIWGGVAVLLQMLAFRFVDLVLRELPARIERDEVSAAIVLVAVKLATALVMAAALWDPLLG